MLYKKTKQYRIYNGDCISIIKKLPKHSIDMVFANPPYLLSNGGITCKSGKFASVNKGEWDKSEGFKKDYQFTKKWLQLVKRVLKPEGTIWISGTYHNIYTIAFAKLFVNIFVNKNSISIISACIRQSMVRVFLSLYLYSRIN